MGWRIRGKCSRVKRKTKARLIWGPSLGSLVCRHLGVVAEGSSHWEKKGQIQCLGLEKESCDNNFRGKIPIERCSRRRYRGGKRNGAKDEQDLGGPKGQKRTWRDLEEEKDM